MELTDIVNERLEQQGIPLPQPLKNSEYPEKQLENNIELWMTYLYHEQPWLGEEFNDCNKNLAERMRMLISEIIMERSSQAMASPCTPDWLDDLIQEWHRRKATVITLNYDTLVENEAVQNIPLTLSQFYPYLSDGDDPPQETFEYYKLHGSVNWHCSSMEDEYNAAISYSEASQPGSATAGTHDRKRLIIPPVTEKTTYFKNSTIRKIWQEAGKKFEQATRVFFIGYSLPLSDLGMQFFLKRYQPTLCAPWYLINPDISVTRKYQGLLSPVQTIIDDFVGEINPVRKFVNHYRNLP